MGGKLIERTLSITDDHYCCFINQWWCNGNLLHAPLLLLRPASSSYLAFAFP
jgi:hypothetical protein